jgi:hydroxymethylbilane synthase
MWQANFIKNKIEKNFPKIEVSSVGIKSYGDRDQLSSLTKIGGQGIFTRALEKALIDNKIDIAVHSLKDLPTVLPDSLHISSVPERGSVYDVFIGRQKSDFSQVPYNATIACGSIRRRAQLLALRPDLKFVDLRGNIETRLNKLEEYQCAGIIMAEAAIIRLKLENINYYRFTFEEMLPAVSQGAIGIQSRKSDHYLNPILNSLNDPNTLACIGAERAFLHRLDSGCQFPVAAIAQISEDRMTIHGLVSSKNGKIILKQSISDAITRNEQMGILLAEKLISRGALDMLGED